MKFPRIDPQTPKSEIVETIRSHLLAQGFEIIQVDQARRWGAFLRLPNAQADKFIASYFDGAALPEIARRGERSPKILIVAPHQRLSWQYHSRRAELWRALNADVGVCLSATNTHPRDRRILRVSQVIQIAQGVRHHLVGLDEWGAVAEIWIHTDPHHPSDEDDICRLQDDHSRI